MNKSEAAFRTAYMLTGGHEGLYANDRSDPGGETWRGIARNYHDEDDFPGWLTIDAFKETQGSFDPHGNVIRKAINQHFQENYTLNEEVRLFYKAKFWRPWWGNRIAELSGSIAIEMYDTAVNMGHGRAVRFLQRALNSLDRNTLEDLAEDGAMGPATYARYQMFADKEEQIIMKMLNVQQGAFYMKRFKQNEDMEKYARGWFGRVEL